MHRPSSAAPTADQARTTPARSEPGAATADLALTTNARLAVREVTSGPRTAIVGSSLTELFSPADHLRLVTAVRTCLGAKVPSRLVARATGWSTDLYALLLKPIEAADGTAIAIAGIRLVANAPATAPSSRSGRQPGPSSGPPDRGNDPSGSTSPQPEGPGTERTGAVDTVSVPVDETLRRLLDLAPIAVFVKDRSARFIYGNRVLLDSFGIDSVDEIIGRSDFDFHETSDAEAFHLDDRCVIDDGVVISERPEQRIGSDGSIEYLHTTKMPVRDPRGNIIGLMGFWTEMTESRMAAEALRTSEQRFALAVRASRDGVWDYDIAGRMFVLSERARQLLDLAPGQREMPWSKLVELFGQAEADRMVESIGNLLDEPTGTITHIAGFRQADGSQRWLEIHGTAFAVDGKVSRIIGSAADITDDRRKETELRYQATHDDLTALANRRAVLSKLEEHLAAGTGCSLLYLDLDGFKVINDSLGHEAGDTMLITVGERLAGLAGPNDTVARLGGDEFAILVAGDNHRHRTIELASTRIAEVLGSPITVDDAELYTRTSIGVVLTSEGYRDAAAMLRDGDTAMYRAKADRSNDGYCVFEREMGLAAIKELNLQTRLRRAMDLEEFELHFQPVFESGSLSMTSVEALLRWRTDGELIGPDRFLPFLESSGLIVDVGAWVVHAGCAQLAAWSATDPRFDRIGLALNLSRRQFDNGDLVHVVATALERHDLSPDRITAEVTETAVAGDVPQLLSGLSELRELGVRIALDDFGVGQSSLSQLHDLPLDILKIDRTFISRITDRQDEPVLEASIRIANALGLTTVAEGVETDDQIDWLVARGCDLLQGFGLARPVTADRVADAFQVAPDGPWATKPRGDTGPTGSS